MFEILVTLTLLVSLLGASYAFVHVRDAMHPAVVLLPFIGFVYGIWPLILDKDGLLHELFGTSDLEYVALLYLLSILSFYLGLNRFRRQQLIAIRTSGRRRGNVFAVTMSPLVRRRLYLLSLIMGVLSVSAYLFMLDNAGGFVRAYSQVKGGGWARSGYVGETVLLSFPAVLLLALSRQGMKKIRWKDVFLALVIASPHLLQGSFGGRRGPLFLVLATLFLSWFIAKGVRPGLKVILVGLAAIAFAVIVVQSQRQHIYLGSGGEFEAERIVEAIESQEVIEHNDYVAGVSTVLTVDYFDDYYWGHRYFVTIFIRPIPRQIWPTKYEDMGADWINRFDWQEGGAEYLQAVGFRPPVGSAVGFVADIYHEFSWGVLLALYFFGLGLEALWKRHCLRGGLWTVIYVEACILAVYLPTQSFSAFFHRFMFMSLITYLIWKYMIHRGVPESRSAPAGQVDSRWSARR